MDLFRDEGVMQIIKDVLRTSRYSRGIKLQTNDNKDSFPLQALCASILHDLNENSFEWPIEFIEIYLEDALGARIWVDSVQAYAFCESMTKKYTPSTSVSALLKANEGDDSDSSSGNEEVMEDSTAAAVAAVAAEAVEKRIISNSTTHTNTSSTTAVVPGSSGSSSALASKGSGKSTIYRFPGNHAEVQSVIKSRIESRVGITDGQITSAGTGAMIETIKTFCHIPSVRLIASKCLDKWITNPALADQVKDLVKHLTGCLEVLDERGGSTSGHLAGSLTSSDMSVVESIVMLRTKLKVQTQIEVYKVILISIVNKGSAVARSVIKLLVQGDLRSGAIKAETLKYITNLLLSIKDSSSTNGVSSSSSSSRDDGGRRSSCIIFAEAIRDICTNSEHWSAVQSKVIIELVAKILRTMDMVRVDVASFITALLGNTYGASMTLYHGWNEGSNELFKFYSEIITAVQLLLSHEICAPRKVEHIGAHVNAEGHPGHNAPAHHKPPPAMGGRLGGRGAGPGRGEAGGRGGKPGMFAGKKFSNVPSFIKPAKKILQPESGGSMSTQASSSSSASNQTSSSSVVDSTELLRKNLLVQEAASSWFHQVLAYYTKQPSREVRDECVYALDWLAKVLCMQQSHNSTILDKIVDKTAGKYAMEQSYLSSKVLIAVIDIIKMTSRSHAHLSSGFTFIESLINRTLNRPPRKLGNSSSAQNLRQMDEETHTTNNNKDDEEYYLEISDHIVVDKLFDLCVIKIQRADSNRTIVSSPSAYETSELEANRRPKNTMEKDVTENSVAPGSRDRSFSLGSNDGMNIQGSTSLEAPEPMQPLLNPRLKTMKSDWTPMKKTKPV